MSELATLYEAFRTLGEDRGVILAPDTAHIRPTAIRSRAGSPLPA